MLVFIHHRGHRGTQSWVEVLRLRHCIASPPQSHAKNVAEQAIEKKRVKKLLNLLCEFELF